MNLAGQKFKPRIYTDNTDQTYYLIRVNLWPGFKMKPRTFLTYFILCAIPLLLLAVFSYWNGLRTVDSNYSAIVQSDLNAFNTAVEDELRERESAILQLSMTQSAQRIVTEKYEGSTDALPPQNPRALLNALPDLGNDFKNLTIYDSNKRAVFFRAGRTEWTFIDARESASKPPPDPRVWTQQGHVALQRPGDSVSTLEFTVPVHDETGIKTTGAVVGVLELESVFAQAARGLDTKSSQGSMVIVLDHSGTILYHPNPLLKSRPINEALPPFSSIAKAMTANESGTGAFDLPYGFSYSNPFRYITAYAPNPRLNVAVAVARHRSAPLSAAHRWGVAGLLLALFTALGAAFALVHYEQRRTKGMARVSEDLSAIAKGELDRRIILQSSDDARGLADNINVVTERLRAQIAREEESRQFESFVRISAMLTHDLKNAIEGLSLTVGNMERHFDNPQFRADALKGLTTATDKLKALVARLARPLTSLSGEHKRPTNVDLVPILRRVIAMTAEPMRNKYTIVTRLPPSVFALVDAARIEEVMENLVLNALEAMENGGTLTIEAGQTANGSPTFSVSDTGKGMSRTFIETRLFRPFSTTKKTGIGLGLYTCREVITASSGSIHVESVQGAGTTFRVVLPSIPHDRRN